MLGLNTFAVALIAALLATIGGLSYIGKVRSDAFDTGYEKAQAEAQKVASEQQQRMIDLQRMAEKRYVVQVEARERVITKTITEVRHETQNLAACVLSPGARRLLNDAARAAYGDPASSGSAGEPVRGPE